MDTNGLGALSTFLTVAEERSFTRAGKRLCVSPSAISHSMRELEEGIGVRLLSRTTRSVALTEAGEHLRARLRPAFSEIHEALGEITGLGNQPVGRVRLLVPRLAVDTVLAPKVGDLVRRYPDVLLDITTDDSRIDIVARGFDAGKRRDTFRRVHREGHDRSARVSGPQTRDRRLAKVPPIAPEA